MNLFRKEGE